MPERLAEGSCRVEMKAVGICGSDVHFWKKVTKPCLTLVFILLLPARFPPDLAGKHLILVTSCSR